MSDQQQFSYEVIEAAVKILVLCVCDVAREKRDERLDKLLNVIRDAVELATALEDVPDTRPQ